MIDKSMIEQFKNDGAICIRQAVTTDTAQPLLENLDKLVASSDDR